MTGDIADDVTLLVLIALMVGGLASLALSLPAAYGALDRHGWPFALLAVSVAAGVGWLILFAAGEDTYFAPDHVSRWEYAARNGRSPTVVAAIVLAIVSIVSLVTAARSTRIARLRRFTMPVAALAIVAIITAAIAPGTGH
jgi:hypothetical protein